MRHGAGTRSGIGHSQVVVGRGLPDYGETLFLVHNWLQGRGHPAEGPFGAPEASQEEASRVAAPFPGEKKGIGHSLVVLGPLPLPPGRAFLSAVRNLWGVCGELYCSMGWQLSTRLMIAASGRSLWVSFSLVPPLCQVSSRCGGCCPGASEREQALPTVRSLGTGEATGEGGGPIQPGDLPGGRGIGE